MRSWMRIASSSARQSPYPERLLSQVFKRLGFVVPKPDVEAVCNCQGGSVERVLKLIKTRIAKYVEDGEPDLG